MILLDSSGLFAALVRAQRGHELARRALAAERGSLVLSPFVLAEVDYLITSSIGVDTEIALLEEIAGGAYQLAAFDESDVAEAARVIQTYRGLGIGLADASIVVLAGRLGTDRVLTLDERHFRALRTPEGKPFTLLPADA